MKTQKHNEKLVGRRAEYGDRKVSNRIDRRAAELMSLGMTEANARSAALREMIQSIK